MPPIDISHIHNKVFGICCLEKEERSQVKAVWDARFAENTAFWTEATPQDSASQIVKALCQRIQEQGIFTMNGEQCILALFLDLRQSLTPEFQDELWRVSQMLRNVLNCNIFAVLEFGYVGLQGFESAELQRNNARSIVEKNSAMPAAVQHRLCLVGKPVLVADGGNSWKAVVLYLDTLRRLINPGNLLPMTTDGKANDDIGFLRYGEYNKKEYDALVQRRDRLQALCSQGGADEVREQITKKRESIRAAIESQFQIRGMIHPQHPDMIVENSWFDADRKAARNGRNRKYSAAQAATSAAVVLTGKRLKDDIISLFDAEVDKAQETLATILRETNAGLQLRLDKSTMSILLEDGERQISEPKKPELAYSENGCDHEINEYLVNMKAHAISVGMKKYSDALRAAYEGISYETLQNELFEKNAELVEMNKKIGGMGTAEQFCSTYAFHSNPPECDFNPIAAAGVGVKYLLLRGNDMRAAANTGANGAMIPVYEIKELGGGIQVLDKAPLKTIQAVFLDCTDHVLHHLLP